MNRRIGLFVRDPKIWATAAAALWILGQPGSDAYLLPALVCLVLAQSRTAWFEPSTLADGWRNLEQWLMDRANWRWAVGAWIVVGAIRVASSASAAYSLSWHVWDVGIHTNIVYNMSRGYWFSTYLGIHSLADHFTPGLIVFAWLNAIAPSVHWLTVSKAVAYVACPWLFYRLALSAHPDLLKARRAAFLAGAAWMLFYAPAVNSVRFEFQASSLAPPLVICAFISLNERRWARLGACLCLLLTLKEHLGVVWIGLGLYLFFAEKRRWLGTCVCVAGSIVLVLVMLVVMPEFGRTGDRLMQQIAIFDDVGPKLLYLVKVFWPLAFFPIIDWRRGVAAFCAVAVNVTSSAFRPGMYSGSNHYGDVPSTILLCVLVLGLADPTATNAWKAAARLVPWRKGLAVLWLAVSILLLPVSPLRTFMRNIPTSAQLAAYAELQDFAELVGAQPIAVDWRLGGTIVHGTARMFDVAKCSVLRLGGDVPEPIFIAFSEITAGSGYDACERQLEEDPHHERLEQFKRLAVFRRSPAAH